MDSVDLSNTALKDLTDDQEKEHKLEYKLYKSSIQEFDRRRPTPTCPHSLEMTGDASTSIGKKQLKA